MALPKITKQDIEEEIEELGLDPETIDEDDVEMIRQNILMKKFSTKDILAYSGKKFLKGTGKLAMKPFSAVGNVLANSLPGKLVKGTYKLAKTLKGEGDVADEAREEYMRRFGIDVDDEDAPKKAAGGGKGAGGGGQIDVKKITDRLDETNDYLDEINQNIENIKIVSADQETIDIPSSENILLKTYSPNWGGKRVGAGRPKGSKNSKNAPQAITTAAASSVAIPDEISDYASVLENTNKSINDLLNIEQDVAAQDKIDKQDDLEEYNRSLERDELLEDILDAIQLQNEEMLSADDEEKDDKDDISMKLLSLASTFLPMLGQLAVIAGGIFAAYKAAQWIGDNMEEWGNKTAETIKDIIPERLAETGSGADDASMDMIKEGMARKDETGTRMAVAASIHTAESGAMGAVMDKAGHEDEDKDPSMWQNLKYAITGSSGDAETDAIISGQNVQDTAKTESKKVSGDAEKLHQTVQENKDLEKETQKPIVINTQDNKSGTSTERDVYNQKLFNTRNPNDSYTKKIMNDSNYPTNR